MADALVLSGGSIKGAFEAGAISVVLERGFKPTGIFGISAGALNGAFLADRVGRQLRAGETIDWPEIGRELVEFWVQHVTTPSDIIESRWAGSVLTDVLFNHFQGLTKTDRLHAVVNEQIKRDNLLAALNHGVHYRAGSVDLFTGEIQYPDASEAKINEFIYASTAIPIAMPYVNIKYGPWGESHPLVDGGIRDVAPLRKAIDAGYDNIICVVCQTESVGGLIFNPGKLLSHIDRVTDIIVNELVNNDLNIIKSYKQLVGALTRGARISKKIQRYAAVPLPKVIRPLTPIDVDIQNFSSEQIQGMIDLGIDAAKHVIGQARKGASAVKSRTRRVRG